MDEAFLELILKVGLWTLGGILTLMILWEMKWFILFCAFVGVVSWVLWRAPSVKDTVTDTARQVPKEAIERLREMDESITEDDIQEFLNDRLNRK